MRYKILIWFHKTFLEGWYSPSRKYQWGWSTQMRWFDIRDYRMVVSFTSNLWQAELIHRGNAVCVMNGFQTKETAKLKVEEILTVYLQNPKL